MFAAADAQISALFALLVDDDGGGWRQSDGVFGLDVVVYFQGAAHGMPG